MNLKELFRHKKLIKILLKMHKNKKGLILQMITDGTNYYYHHSRTGRCFCGSVGGEYSYTVINKVWTSLIKDGFLLPKVVVVPAERIEIIELDLEVNEHQFLSKMEVDERNRLNLKPNGEILWIK